MTSGTCSSGDSGRGHVLPSRIDLSSEDVDMKKWFGLSVIVYLRSPSTMLCSVLAASPGAMMCSAHGEDLVVENAFIPKRVEGNPIYDSVIMGTNQLEHFANVLRGKAVDVVHESTCGYLGVESKGYEPSSTTTGVDGCSGDEIALPNATRDASMNTDARVPAVSVARQVKATSNILNSTDDANKQVLIGPGLINHGLLEALCAEFAVGIMLEMLQMPTTLGENPLAISKQMKIEINVNILPKSPAWSSDSRCAQPSNL